jgi:hypothetical protein
MSAISLTNIPASTTSTTSTGPATSLQTYFKERAADVKQLNIALQSGDLNAAKTAYNNLVLLSNNALGRTNPFLKSDRATDFSAIGSALNSGDLAGAQQAFTTLQSTWSHRVPLAASTSSAAAAGGTSASESGVDVVA